MRQKSEGDSTKMENKNQDRIQELISELACCRDDERDSYNQIVQVISVVGSVLGVVFGASFLGKADNEELIQGEWGEIITETRVLFWLSSIVFCTAFMYIVVLGIGNLLRYYYIQNIEDRLTSLISGTKDNVNRGDLLHWNAYIAPMQTRNPKHITNSNTLLHYICYTIVVIGIILFSTGIVFFQYKFIDDRKIYDEIVLAIVIVMILGVFCLFLRLSLNGEKVAQYMWNTAHENQKIRLGFITGKKYENSVMFAKNLKYFIYSRLDNLPKPMLVILGSICWKWMVKLPFTVQDVLCLLFFLLVFDVLAYQVRFQVNDLRGLEEDEQIGRKNRLCYTEENKKNIIKFSIRIIIVKIVLIFVLVCLFGKSEKNFILVSLSFLFFSSIVYEIARSKKCKRIVYFLVGTGYPLRFWCGYFILQSENWAKIPELPFLFLLMAIWAYGSFASILSWASEVNGMIKKRRDTNQVFLKEHFNNIQEYLSCKIDIKSNSGYDFLLRARGRVLEPWNFCYLLSNLFLVISIMIKDLNMGIIIEGVLLLTLFLGTISSHKRIVIWSIISIFICFARSLVRYLVMGGGMWHFMISAIQIMIIVTYFLLRYQPRMRKISLKIVYEKVLRIIFGEKVADITCRQNEN